MTQQCVIGLFRGISSYKETFELTPSDARKYHSSSLFDCTSEYQIESQGNVTKSSGIKRIETKQKSMDGEMAATKHSMMYGIIKTTMKVFATSKSSAYVLNFSTALTFVFHCFSGVLKPYPFTTTSPEKALQPCQLPQSCCEGTSKCKRSPKRRPFPDAWKNQVGLAFALNSVGRKMLTKPRKSSWLLGYSVGAN